MCVAVVGAEEGERNVVPCADDDAVDDCKSACVSQDDAIGDWG